MQVFLRESFVFVEARVLANLLRHRLAIGLVGAENQQCAAVATNGSQFV